MPGHDARIIPGSVERGTWAMSDHGVCGVRPSEGLSCFTAARSEWAPAPFSGATNVSVAGPHACALVDGQPACWDLPSGRPRTTALVPAATPLRSIGVESGGGVVGRDEAGQWYAWERDGTPVRTAPLAPHNEAVFAPSEALVTNGRICLTSPTRPERIPPSINASGHALPLWFRWCPRPPDIPRGLAVSAFHREGSCGVTGAGFVSCHGLATPGTTPASSYAGNRSWRTAMGLIDVSSVSAGHEHLCAIDDGGRVWCWGTADAGQLGYDLPSQATLAPFNVVDRGARHLSMDGFRICWVDGKDDGYCRRQRTSEGFGEAKPDHFSRGKRDVLPDTRGYGDFATHANSSGSWTVAGDYSLAGPRGRAAAFSGGCILYRTGVVACANDPTSDVDENPLEARPFRKLGKGVRMSATDREVCIVDSKGDVRCAPRWFDPDDPSWVGPTATTLLSNASDMAISEVGVCAVVDAAVECARPGSKVHLASLGSNGLIAVGDVVCTADGASAARCATNLGQILRGHEPTVVRIDFVEPVEQLMTDGQLLCARTAKGRIACAGRAERYRLGQRVEARPRHVTEYFVRT
ncbi:MAG: RCC1 domain-containing protein [Myxococcota bacterium]